MFKYSHSWSTWSNSLGEWISSGVRGDELAGGLLAVSILRCKPSLKTLEAQSLWVLGRYHVAIRLIGST